MIKTMEFDNERIDLPARQLEFFLRDSDGNTLIRRIVTFPYDISMERLDKEIGFILLRIHKEREG